MSTSTVCSSSSSSSLRRRRRPRPFHDLFVDFPKPIRDKLVASSMEVMQQCLANAVSDIRGLSNLALGNRQDVVAEFGRLRSELDAVEAAGLEAGEYKKRLDELQDIADMYGEGMECAGELRRKKRRLMKELEEVQNDVVTCASELEECRALFKSRTEMPWDEERDRRRLHHQLMQKDDHESEVGETGTEEFQGPENDRDVETSEEHNQDEPQEEEEEEDPEEEEEEPEEEEEEVESMSCKSDSDYDPKKDK